MLKFYVQLHSSTGYNFAIYGNKNSFQNLQLRGFDV